jgi:hypothetical protein
MPDTYISREIVYYHQLGDIGDNKELDEMVKACVSSAKLFYYPMFNNLNITGHLRTKLSNINNNGIYSVKAEPILKNVCLLVSNFKFLELCTMNNCFDDNFDENDKRKYILKDDDRSSYYDDGLTAFADSISSKIILMMNTTFSNPSKMVKYLEECEDGFVTGIIEEIKKSNHPEKLDEVMELVDTYKCLSLKYFINFLNGCIMEAYEKKNYEEIENLLSEVILQRKIQRNNCKRKKATINNVHERLYEEMRISKSKINALNFFNARKAKCREEMVSDFIKKHSSSLSSLSSVSSWADEADKAEATGKSEIVKSATVPVTKNDFKPTAANMLKMNTLSATDRTTMERILTERVPLNDDDIAFVDEYKNFDHFFENPDDMLAELGDMSDFKLPRSIMSTTRELNEAQLVKCARKIMYDFDTLQVPSLVTGSKARREALDGDKARFINNRYDLPVPSYINTKVLERHFNKFSSEQGYPVITIAEVSGQRNKIITVEYSPNSKFSQDAGFATLINHTIYSNNIDEVSDMMNFCIKSDKVILSDTSSSRSIKNSIVKPISSGNFSKKNNVELLLRDVDGSTRNIFGSKNVTEESINIPPHLQHVNSSSSPLIPIFADTISPVPGIIEKNDFRTISKNYVVVRPNISSTCAVSSSSSVKNKKTTIPKRENLSYNQSTLFSKTKHFLDDEDALDFEIKRN